MKNRLFILLLFVALGCSRRGTDTGNPKEPLNDGSGAGGGAMLIVVKSCDRLASCNNQTVVSQCIQDQASITRYSEKLGLSSEYNLWSLADVVYGEVNEFLISDALAAETCVDDINKLSCDDPAILQAYEALDVNKYERVVEMLRPSCAKVFNQ
jgi:hypothetical protein